MDPFQLPALPPVYTVESWGFRRILGGLVDVADDLVAFIPLGSALKDKKVLAAKYTIPFVIDLFPAPPSFTQLPFFANNERRFLSGIEQFLGGNYKTGIDHTLGAMLLGVLDDGVQSGVAVHVVPVWLCDP